MEIIREVIPLSKNDCFAILLKEKNAFNLPLHNHDHIEINLILNGSGARRIVGNHIGEVGAKELVCIGPNLAHGWFNHNNKSHPIKEVTIQFRNDLINDELLGKNQLINIRNMFENAKRGFYFLSPQLIKSNQGLSLWQINQVSTRYLNYYRLSIYYRSLKPKYYPTPRSLMEIRTIPAEE